MLKEAVVLAALHDGGLQVPAPMQERAAVTLRWEAPVGCPDHAAVASAIAARQPVDPVTVDARVTATDVGVVADLVIDSAHGSTQRRLQSPSCDSIVDAVALLVQVAADPLPTPARIAPASGPAAQQLAPPELPEEPALAPTPTVQRTRPAQRRPRPKARLAAMGTIGAGTLPRLDAGGRVSIGIATRRLLADVGATILAPQRARTPADVEVAIAAFGGVARVCPVVPLDGPRLELSVCAALTAGVLRGRSSGAAIVGPDQALQPWVRLAAAPELAVVVHPRVRVTATLEAGGHVVRSGFAVAGLGQVWTPRPWAIHGSAGIEVRLW